MRRAPHNGPSGQLRNITAQGTQAPRHHGLIESDDSPWIPTPKWVIGAELPDCVGSSCIHACLARAGGGVRLYNTEYDSRNATRAEPAARPFRRIGPCQLSGH